MDVGWLMVEDVQEAIDDIESAKDDDDEIAHRLEDQLYRQILRQIACGHPMPSEMAEAVLQAQDVRFPRFPA